MVPIKSVNAETDTELARKLDRKTRIKRPKNFNDEVHVIKLSEAMTCVETAFNDTSLLTQFLLGAAKAVFGDQGSRTAAQGLADKIGDCLRENCLRQDTPRVAKRTETHGRPAKGHGYGKGQKKAGG